MNPVIQIFETELECAHCGGVAIEKEDGVFYDGDGGSCETCGFPGLVSVDSESDAYWVESDDEDAVCNDPGCEDCRDRRAKGVAP